MVEGRGRKNSRASLGVASLVLVLTSLLATPAQAQLERVVADAQGIT